MPRTRPSRSPSNPPQAPVARAHRSPARLAFTSTPNQVGNWIVTFSQENGCSDSVTIAVTWDQICDVTATSTSVEVGDQVTVTGTGFFPNAQIVVTVQTPGPSGAQGGPTDGTGTFVVTFTANLVGNYVVTFTQENACSDSVTIAAGATGAGPTPPAPSGASLPGHRAAQSAGPDGHWS